MIIHQKKTDICINFNNVDFFRKMSYLDITVAFSSGPQTHDLTFSSEEERDLAFNKIIRGVINDARLVEI
jgi:hypothetical protein